MQYVRHISVILELLEYYFLLIGNDSFVKEDQEFNVSCSESFFYDERSLLCVPQCGEWSPLSSDVHTVLSVLVLIGNVASVIICTTILVLSFIQHKQM